MEKNQAASTVELDGQVRMRVERTARQTGLHATDALTVRINARPCAGRAQDSEALPTGASSVCDRPASWPRHRALTGGHQQLPLSCF